MVISSIFISKLTVEVCKITIFSYFSLWHTPTQYDITQGKNISHEIKVYINNTPSQNNYNTKKKRPYMIELTHTPLECAFLFHIWSLGSNYTYQNFFFLFALFSRADARSIKPLPLTRKCMKVQP